MNADGEPLGRTPAPGAKVRERLRVNPGCMDPGPASIDMVRQCAGVPSWHACGFLTCSVLPVRSACNCRCPFCFSKSSISALERDEVAGLDLDRYFAFARERGATRLVVTGGGEPLLRKAWTLAIVRA